MFFFFPLVALEGTTPTLITVYTLDGIDIIPWIRGGHVT